MAGSPHVILPLVLVDAVSRIALVQPFQSKTLDEAAFIVAGDFARGEPEGTSRIFPRHPRRIDRPKRGPETSLRQREIEDAIAAIAEAGQERLQWIASVLRLHLAHDCLHGVGGLKPQVAAAGKLRRDNDEFARGPYGASLRERAMPREACPNRRGRPFIVAVQKAQERPNSGCRRGAARDGKQARQRAGFHELGIGSIHWNLVSYCRRPCLYNPPQDRSASHKNEDRRVGLRPFLKTRFRAIPGDADEGGHWLGGEAVHNGAICPNCKIPLLLLWDINAKDPRFPHGKFGALERVPLYYCWGCGADLAYRVVAPNRIKIVSTDRVEGLTFQYEPYPSHFERRPLALSDEVPDALREAITSWDMEKDPFARSLPKKQRKTLADFFGHEIVFTFDLFHHQFGGVPLNRLWEENVYCPNKECGPGLANRLMRRSGRKMSFLAGILNDPQRGLPMIERVGETTESSANVYVSVQFHICGKCWTLHACNRAD